MRRVVVVCVAFTLIAAACSGADPLPPTTVSPPPTAGPTPSITTAPPRTTHAPGRPALQVTDPARAATVGSSVYLFRGTTDPGSSVVVAGSRAEVDEAGNWSIALTLEPGENVTTFTATAPSGATTEVRHSVYYAPWPTADAAAWQRWSTTNHIQPQGVMVDPAGDVWVISYGGLVRWRPDAGTWMEVRDASWPEPVPRSVAFSGTDLWFGFYNHVVRWSDGRWTAREFVTDDPSAGPIALATEPSGIVVAGAPQLGVHRFDGARWERLPDVPERGDIETVAIDDQGRIWVGTFWSGLWVLDGGQWVKEHSWPVADVAMGPGRDVWFAIRDMRIMSDQSVTVWHVDGETGKRTGYPMGHTTVWDIAPMEDAAYVGTDLHHIGEGNSGGGLWLLSGGDITPVPGGWDDAGRQILGVAVDTGGAVWLGGQSGLWRYDGRVVDHFMTDTFSSFGADFVEVAAPDRVWVVDCSTPSLWDGRHWRALPVLDADLWGCDGEFDEEGTMWLAGWEGIAHFDEEGWHLDRSDADGALWLDLYPECEGELCDDPKWTLTATVDGGMWAGMVGATDALWSLEPGGWQRLHDPFPAGSGVIVDMAAGDDGALWVATLNAVHVLRDGSWTHHVSGPDGPPARLRHIGVGGGVLWASSYEEVARFDGATWARVDAKEWSDRPVMYVDEDGGVWRSTASGAVRMDGSSAYVLDLPFPGEGYLYSMAKSPDGSWWMAGGGNVYRWSLQPTG